MGEKLPKLRLCIECAKLFDVEFERQYICRKCEKELNKDSDDGENGKGSDISVENSSGRS